MGAAAWVCFFFSFRSRPPESLFSSPADVPSPTKRARAAEDAADSGNNNSNPDDDFVDVAPLAAALPPVAVAAPVPKLPGKKSKTKSDAQVRAAAERKAKAIARRSAADDVLIALTTSYEGLVQYGSCTCFLLRSASIATVRRLCAAREPPVAVSCATDGQTDGSNRPPEVLFCDLCSHCKSEGDVRRQLEVINSEGVPSHCWRPQIDLASLSVCDAFHLFVLQTAAAFPDPIDGPVLPWRFELDRFRAHLMKHINTNFTYYVVRKKSNRRDGELLLLSCFFVAVDFAHA